MCYGSSNSASNAATAQQAAQQASINSNVSAINAAFAGRQSQYTNYQNALNSSYQTQLNQQDQTASRNLKFALAGSGETGSSVAADQGGQLQQQMGQGEVTAQEQAQSKTAALESSDNAEQQQLTQLAETGANIGNAGQQAATGLTANLNNAQSALGPNTLGNVFGGVTNTINNMNTAAQTRLGLKAAQAYTGAFTNSATTSSGFGGAAPI
jgi:hypothetical protein